MHVNHFPYLSWSNRIINKVYRIIYHYISLENVRDIIYHGQISPLADMGRGSTQEPPCRGFVKVGRLRPPR